MDKEAKNEIKKVLQARLSTEEAVTEIVDVSDSYRRRMRRFSEQRREIEGELRAKETPSERWDNLKKRILAEIETIDNDTTGGEIEPKWWLEMSSIRRSLLNPDT